MHIKLSAVPMLDPDEVEDLTLLNVKDVMATKVYSLREAETLANIVTALDTTEHNAFPLVGDEAARVTRERRASKERLGGGNQREESGGNGHDHTNGGGSPTSRSPEAQRPPEGPPRRQFAGIISRERLEHVLSISGVVSEGQRLEAKAASTLGTRLVDLRPHCDRSPYVVNELLPLRRVFRLFSLLPAPTSVFASHHSHAGSTRAP